MLLVLVVDNNYWSCVVLQPSGTNESCFLVALERNDDIPANRLYGGATSRPILQPCLRCVLCSVYINSSRRQCELRTRASWRFAKRLDRWASCLCGFNYRYLQISLQYLSLIYLCYCSNVLVLKVLANV